MSESLLEILERKLENSVREQVYSEYWKDEEKIIKNRLERVKEDLADKLVELVVK